MQVLFKKQREKRLRLQIVDENTDACDRNRTSNQDYVNIIEQDSAVTTEFKEEDGSLHELSSAERSVERK